MASDGQGTSAGAKRADQLRPVTRALRLIQTIGQGSSTGWTLLELSKHLNLPNASVYRILNVLESERFVIRSPTSKRYFIGPAFTSLTQGHEPAIGYLSAPHPQIRELAKETMETVFATELHAGRAVCVALAQTKHPLRLFVRIGQEMPIHAAASARVLLADLDQSSAETMLRDFPMKSYTEDTPQTIQEVIEHLPKVRARGYDLCDNELDRGVWAVAAPIRQADGRVCASLTLAAPKQRVTAEQQYAIIEKVVASANAIATDLGWHGTSPADPSTDLG